MEEVKVTTLDCEPEHGDVINPAGKGWDAYVLHPNAVKSPVEAIKVELPEGSFWAIRIGKLGERAYQYKVSDGHLFCSMREKGKLRRLRQMKLVNEHGESPSMDTAERLRLLDATVSESGGNIRADFSGVLNVSHKGRRLDRYSDPLEGSWR